MTASVYMGRKPDEFTVGRVFRLEAFGYTFAFQFKT